MPFSQFIRDNQRFDHQSCEVGVSIARMSLRNLRKAIQTNQVSFPSQVPVFACQSRPDIQWRLVELYFVRGWSCVQIGERYQVTMERVRQIISNWVQRAITLGYIQEVPPAVAHPPVNAIPTFPEMPSVMITNSIAKPMVERAGASRTT